MNYALYLEYLEADFYRLAVRSGHLRGRALELAKRFGAQEQGHVVTLEGTVKSLGGTPTARPKSSFTLTNAAVILRTMNQLESLGVAAYLGQLDRIALDEASTMPSLMV